MFMGRLFKMLIVLFTLPVLVFTGCGGSSGKNNPPTEQTYTVAFISNGGVPAPQSVRVNSGGTASAPADMTRTGYDFEGWYRESGFTNKVTFPITVTQNITLYAKWIEREKEVELIHDETELYTKIMADLSGNFRLSADISLKGFTWIPIGTEEDPFIGTFDGNGYKIMGLKIENAVNAESVSLFNEEGKEEYVGFFRYVAGGEIKNLILEDVDISGGRYVGAIAGYLENGKITNSSISGKIAASSEDSELYAGGIVGYMVGGTVDGCSSSVEITVGAEGDSWDYDAYAGGIAGYLTGGGAITGSSNTGKITAGSEQYYVLAGGIAGYLSSSYNDLYYPSKITNSYNAGEINSSNTAGGITGEVSGSVISNSYNTGKITAYSEQYVTYAGGITGRLGSIYPGGSEIIRSKITDSYNTGEIRASSKSSDAYSGGLYSGGIVGFMSSRGTISNSYNTGKITASAEFPTAGAAGIAAYVSSGSTITNNAAINKTIDSTLMAGRIVSYIGTYEISDVSNNFALGTMAVSGDTGDGHNGVSKTDAEFRTQTTYEGAIVGDGDGGLGWKFGNDDDNPWKMPIGGGYPILYWQQ